MWLRLRLTASPPFCPALRASVGENSCAVPCLWAARPPAAAISRCRWSLIPAKPRPLLDARRDRPARAADFEERPAGDLRARVRDRVERDFVVRDFAPRDFLRATSVSPGLFGTLFDVLILSFPLWAGSPWHRFPPFLDGISAYP